jgi:hypothetical protein
MWYVAMCKMNCVYIKIMLKVESLKTELLKVSPPVPCGVVQHRPHHKEKEETLLTLF